MKFKELKKTLYFYFYKFFGRKPKVLSKNETIRKILDEQLSISRFGDGEISLLLKTGGPKFQMNTPQLSKELQECFKIRSPKLLICLSNIDYRFPFKSPEAKHYRNYLFYTFRKAKKENILDFKYTYGNTDITRFYHPTLYKKTNFKETSHYINLLKKIWDKRNVILVEGKDTKLGIGNDLFHNTLSTKRILCPSINAYGYIDIIIESIIKNYKPGALVLVALGPTASVVSAKIAVQTDIQIIDIGHVDVIYLWFINKAKEKKSIEYKYVNEASSQDIIKIDFDENVYKSEIIDVID